MRQVTDASGQVTATIDPRGLTAFTYTRDLRGRVLATASVDAGPSWTLPDAFDRPARAWDARAQRENGGATREHQSSELSELPGDLTPGVQVRTADGVGSVVSLGEPPNLNQVSQPPPPVAIVPLSPEQVARRTAHELRGDIVKDLSKPGSSSGAIGAQADKRVGAELIRMANAIEDVELATTYRAPGTRLVDQGKSGMHK